MKKLPSVRAAYAYSGTVCATDFYKALAFLPRVCYTEFAKLTAYAKDQGVRFPVRGYIGLFSAY